MARNKQLDADALYRCKEHMNLLVDSIDGGVLWNEYGIVADLVVCHTPPPGPMSTLERRILTCNIIFPQPFTNDFPRADIYILLSFDILHQLIKGAFKDHLVEWIQKFLHKEYGKGMAQVILDDIDRR